MLADEIPNPSDHAYDRFAKRGYEFDHLRCPALEVERVNELLTYSTSQQRDVVSERREHARQCFRFFFHTTGELTTGRGCP